MKKLFISIILTIISFTYLNAQYHYFSKKIDLGYDEVASVMSKVGDGLIMFSNYEQLLYKLDTLGNLVWKKKLEKGFYAYGLDFRNDSIFIFGQKYIDWTLVTDKELCMQTYNTKGDSLNTIYLGDNKKYDIPTTMLPTEDGGFLYLVNRRTTPDYEPLLDFDSLVVFKTSLTGKLLWQHTVASPADSLILKYYKTGYLYESRKGEYCFVFGSHIKGKKNNEGERYFHFFVQFNEKGVFKSTQRFKTSDKELYYRLIPTSDGKLFGEYDYFDWWYIGSYPSQVVLMDYDLNIIKKGTKLGQNNNRKNKVYLKQELSKDRGFISVGVNTDYDSLSLEKPAVLHGGGPWIAKFNKDGIMEWDRIIIDFRYLRTDEAGVFWGCVEMGNGDYILSGDIDKDINQKETTYDLWLVRVDSMGCPYPNCKGKLQAINNKTDNEEVSGELQGVKIMPNPTTGPLWFEIPDDLLQKDVTVQCFDLSGRNVYQRDFIATQSIFNLDIGDLSNGLYFVRIQDKNGRGCAKKILKYE